MKQVKQRTLLIYIEYNHALKKEINPLTEALPVSVFVWQNSVVKTDSG